MGVVDIYSASSNCFFRTNSTTHRPTIPASLLLGNKRRVLAMASVRPLEEQQVNDGQKHVTGDSFIRSHFRKLSPYQPILPFEETEKARVIQVGEMAGQLTSESSVLSSQLGRKPEDIIKLDANENPYGPPPEASHICYFTVFDALGSLKFPYVYPDPESRRLRAALAEDSGLEAEYILAGCGADELIDLIMRCVLDPGDKIVDCPPTFTMYEFDAAVNGAAVIKVPRKSDFSLDIELIRDAVEQEKPKCIFLTSPNNPDGSIISDEVLLEILKLPILVVLDEAYVEFSKIESRMQWVKKHENLIVLRTFSKRAGLAGLRVGYGAFPSSIIEYLWRAKQPYNVSVAAEVAACAALKNPTYLENVKDALLKERDRLYNLLKEVPFLNPYPSHSNFILCKVAPGMDAKKLKEDLAKLGVMIRHYNNKELKGYVRVSVGKPEHTDILMECLRRFY
ncbi:Histidinol-phosphate aminotransferase family [Parasponia andersonii]|uniref:histidinol-phosphate transaminase n=1 Tax=Parasponia andersonii TaxID=3476 RepID=A0A2P5BAB0_PARAD|nr:Histidinol-phosphate aminotransferase family [Parasponia andersonii]